MLITLKEHTLQNSRPSVILAWNVATQSDIKAIHTFLPIIEVPLAPINQSAHQYYCGNATPQPIKQRPKKLRRAIMASLLEA